MNLVNDEHHQESNLELINAHAAGIDIGSCEHWVCVAPSSTEKNIQSFGCFTPDLIELADWLIECQVHSVAMEATGVYWIPLFQILEAKGLEVNLVNAHHVKTVPGRKSDVLDCQWLQKLHSFGLLSASFRPENQVCVLRSYLRQRETLIKGASTHVQRMQKALIQMNLQLHQVISDLTGKTGMAIIRAIHKLARMFYMVWKTGEAYQDLGADYYQQQYQERMVNNLEKKALSLGFELVAKSD